MASSNNTPPVKTSNIETESIGSYKDENSPNTNNNSNTAQTDTTIKSDISDTADILKNINNIKDELCKLPLCPCENDYINNYINPLLNSLYRLSTTSLNLSTSVYYLTNSPIVHPKKSKS